MIGRRTVLILGAGASVDYGFPTGRKLLLDICRNTNKDKSLFHFLNRTMGFEAEKIQQFQEALLNSQAPSVDLFLENRREFEELGKAAMGASLISYESFDAFNREKRDGWYEFLFSLMIEGGRFEDNPLSVITFNYDRSLEAFFFFALCNLYGLDPARAEETVAKILVIHIYGSLGTHLYEPVTEPGRGYTPKLTPESVREAASRIRIMHEVDEGEADVVAERLFQAEEVIFLGFGFHAENIRRLRLQEVAEGRERAKRGGPNWFASRHGMGGGDIARAKALFPSNHQPRFGNNQDSTITEFLKEMPCLI
jgi:hypothetical protein